MNICSNSSVPKKKKKIGTCTNKLNTCIATKALTQHRSRKSLISNHYTHDNQTWTHKMIHGVLLHIPFLTLHRKHKGSSSPGAKAQDHTHYITHVVWCLTPPVSNLLQAISLVSSADRNRGMKMQISGTYLRVENIREHKSAKQWAHYLL